MGLFGISLEPEPDALYNRLDNSCYEREFIQDIRDKSLLHASLKQIQPDYVFHLAAQPLVIKSYLDPVSTFEVNVIGTANLLDELIKIDKVKTVVVATTDKVYKNLENGRKYKESDALEGLDPYSASKVGTEAVIRAWQNIVALEDRISISAVRAGNVIGGGDFAENRLMPDIVRSFMNQQPLTIRNPGSTRPWQHVLDPIRGYVAAAEHSAASSKFPAFNFGPSDASLSVKQVVDIAQNYFNLNVKIEIDDSPQASLHEATLLDLDSSSARSILNWENLWTQESAVESTIKWWKSVLSRELTADRAIEADMDLIAKL